MKSRTVKRTKSTIRDRTGPSRTTPISPPLRILVADDDASIRYFISTILTGAGFEVTTTSDGQQAWEWLRRGHYDLLITDNEMPRLTGLALIERIRQAGMNLPAIVASGTFPVERLRNDRRLRITTALAKPFGVGTLLDAVKHALPGSGGDTRSGNSLPANCPELHN